MEIPQIAKDSIEQMVRQEMSGKTTEIDWYIRSMINCWDMDGFDHRHEAAYAYKSFRIACEIRTWMRRNHYTTRKGTRHSFDCRKEAQGIWSIISHWAMDCESGNITWSYRTVDGLKNAYISFH
jgi:hypothetical protein